MHKVRITLKPFKNQQELFDPDTDVNQIFEPSIDADCGTFFSNLVD
jgi:hypothetical protein